jgi:hypothetical protein
VLNSRGYVVQDLFSRGFYKLVPLGKDSSKPNVECGGVIAIADNPKYWTKERLSQYYHRFHNVATTFGPQLSPSGDGTIVYNHCLDVDSESVREILEPYLPEILKLTCVVKTKKGLHVHWYEHTQHERIGSVSAGRKNRRCTAGYEFEVKTDHRGGLSHLPPSEHRDDVKKKLAQPFRYSWMEDCAHKVGVVDNFMESGLGFYDWLCQDSILGPYIREPNGSTKPVRILAQSQDVVVGEQGVQRSEASSGGDGTATDVLMSEDSSEDSEIQIPSSPPPYMVDEESPSPAAQIIMADIAAKLTTDLYFECADRIYSLVDPYYVQPHRNNAVLAITGTIRRSNNCGISLEDARHIIEQFCSIAGDEEPAARLATLEATYEKEDIRHNGTFAIFEDIIAAFNPSIEDDKLKEEVDKIEKGVYAALDNFFATVTLARRPLIEIDKSKSRYIVVFYDTVEEVEFPTLYSKALGEYYRKVERKSLLLSAAPVPPIIEVWDPIYQQTKYMMTLRHVGQNNKIATRKLDKFMTRDELLQWLRGNASYYYRLDKLAETIHAIVNAYIRHDLVDHRVGTEIEGLVFLPTRGEEQGQILTLSNMERPPVPTQEQARACISVIGDVHKKFYSDIELEVARHAHFLKVGVVAPIDFARRQSGAVNHYDIIPRQDLGGWTDVGKTLGYAAIPLRMYGLSLNKWMGHHSYIVGSGSIDTAARFIEQTRWTTMPVVFDEADRYSEWEDDKEARRILSILKNSTQITNPRDTLTSDSEQV